MRMGIIMQQSHAWAAPLVTLKEALEDMDHEKLGQHNNATMHGYCNIQEHY